MKCPDFLGNDLKEAEIALAREYPNIKYSIVHYDSPKKNPYISEGDVTPRIIRQRCKNGILELTVSFFMNSSKLVNV